MAEFINTADVIGDDEMCDQIIMRTVTEYKENRITAVGQYAFYGCTELVEVDLPEVTSVGSYAFCGCTSLVNVNFPNLMSVQGHTFDGSGITKCVLPSVTDVQRSAFANAKKLKILDIYKKATFTQQTLVYCYDFVALILRSGELCVAQYAPVTWNSTPYIYVPRALLSDTDETKDYRRATNWSGHAAQFRALEDYTVDGTVDGELDETKI